MSTPDSMRRYLDYSPIVDRPVIRWPDGARLAVIVVVNVEHYAFMPAANPFKNPYPGVPAHPDVVGYAHREYGNRVGFWRMLDALDRHAVPVTCSLNTDTLEMFPEVTAAMIERGWTYISHGTDNTTYLYGMTPEQELAFHREAIATVERITGMRMKGLLGPSFTASAETPALIAEAGMTFSLDWFVDDQPFPLKVPSGRLIGVPYSRELNDAFVMPGPPFSGFEADYFAQICRDQFDVLYREGADSGRVMTIALHPFYLGLPHHIRYLDEVLAYVTGHDGVWMAHADEVADHYLEHCYDEAVARAHVVR